MPRSYARASLQCSGESLAIRGLHIHIVGSFGSTPVAAWCMLLSACAPPTTASDSHTTPVIATPVLLSDMGSSRATAYGNANKIVRVEGDLYVTYLDYEGAAYQVKVARLDTGDLRATQTVSIGTGKDNHAGGALLLDHNSRLHVFYGAHADPLKYRYTTASGIGSWSDEKLIDNLLTYPSAIVLPSNEILVAARQGTASTIENPPCSLRLLRIANGTLIDAKTLFISNQQDEAFFDRYADYHPQLLLSPSGRVHLVFLVHERPLNSPLPPVNGVGYGIAYMYSDDAGVTWKDDSQRTLSLPVKLDTLEFIAGVKRGSAISRDFTGFGAALDPVSDQPQVVFNTFEVATGLWETWLAQKKATSWMTRRIGFDLYNSYMAISERGTIDVLSARMLAPTGRSREEMWGNSFHRVVLMESRDDGSSFAEYEVSALTSAGGPRWFPAVQKAPAGRVDEGSLFFLYTAGYNNGSSVFVGRIGR